MIIEDRIKAFEKLGNFLMDFCIENSNSNHREYNYTEVLSDRPNRSGYTIGDHRYKLMVFDNGNQAFYRYDIDPNQTNDLLENTQGRPLGLLRVITLWAS